MWLCSWAASEVEHHGEERGKAKVLIPAVCEAERVE